MIVYLLTFGFDYVCGVYSSEAIAKGHIREYVSEGYASKYFDVSPFVLDAEPTL